MPDINTILSRDSYLLYAELRLFWLVAFIYGLSFALFIIHCATRQSTPGKAGHMLMWAGVVLHIGLIALRALESGRAPFQTLYESLSWFACSAAITYLYVSGKWKDIHLPGIMVSGISMGACLYALLSRSPAVEPLSPALQSYWFEWHVALALFSYAVFVVSASIEAVCLITRPFVKRGRMVYGMTMSDLDGLQAASFKLVALGFPLLTFAVLSGAAWANEAWGRYWSWGPKETWSLITWTVFAVYLHSKTVPALKGLPASVFNLLGFVCAMMTFLGVNWLAHLLGIPSLHVYAV